MSRTCNRVLKDLITIEGGSITTLGKGTIPFVLLMLMIEGGSGTTIDIFFRCFVDKKGMETKLKRRLHFVMFCFLTCYIGFVNGLWSNILAAAFPLPCRFHKKGNPYCLQAIKLAELLCFRFLLKYLKGMRTYDYYILAMREKNQFTVMDPFDELDSSSDESSDFDSPESPRQTLISKLSIKIEGDGRSTSSTLINKKPDIQKHWREVLEAEILRRCKRGQQNQVVDLMRDVSYSHG
ncbi:hypothetical protein HID58_085557 [Brassica napus]|uniref:Uncharacterized protein n=1 Tax=Brassica napus TaxID=3708 RepID=A0ABQ7XMY1_BRANA|nr:hypothetical protein HID58_085557 [Brassica napus]